MKLRLNHLVVCIVLFVFILAACGKSPVSTPTVVATSASVTTNPTNSPSPTEPPASGGCSNTYFPVPSGASWSYSSSGGNLGDYTYTLSVSKTSETGFTLSEVFSTGVNYDIDWNCTDGNLAVLDAGAGSLTMSTSKVTMTSNSVKADGFNIPATFDTGKTWSENVTVEGSVVQKSTSKSVSSQISSQLNCSAVGTDSVTVPAGTFDTVKATCTKKVTVSYDISGKLTQIGANQENITYWFAKDVGFVKSVATGGSNNETIVLTQYKIK
jgi:hypothetical protein